MIFSRERRADDARPVEHHRVDGDGVGQILASHHLDDEGLPGWAVESVDHTHDRGQQHDLPHLHNPGERERSKDERQHHGRGLRDHEQVALVHPIDHHAAPRRDQQRRNRGGKPDNAQHQLRVGQLVDQPGLCHDLHPCPGHGDQLPGEIQSKIAML